MWKSSMNIEKKIIYIKMNPETTRKWEKGTKGRTLPLIELLLFRCTSTTNKKIKLDKFQFNSFRNIAQPSFFFSVHFSKTKIGV